MEEKLEIIITATGDHWIHELFFEHLQPGVVTAIKRCIRELQAEYAKG